MSKVLGVHAIELRPGVKAEEFEKFVIEEVYPLPTIDGMKAYLLKGDRGEGEGKYFWVWEFESVEFRDRYAPTPEGDFSEEFDEVSAPHAAVYQKVNEKFETFLVDGLWVGEDIYTDYVVVGK